MTQAHTAPISRTERRFPRSTTSLQAARAFVVTASGGDSDEVLGATVELIAGELTANAVEQGHGSEYVVAVRLEGDVVAISVTNQLAPDAELPTPDAWGPDHVPAARGRGLGIVDHLASRVDVVADDGSVTVTAYLGGPKV